MTKIAVWPDGTWCEPNEIRGMLTLLPFRYSDFEIIEVEFDDDGEPLLPERFARFNWS